MLKAHHHTFALHGAEVERRDQLHTTQNIFNIKLYIYPQTFRPCPVAQ